MSVFQKSMTAGLLALTLGGAILSTSGTAEARDHFWGGVAAGAVGGIIGGALISQARPTYAYPEPVYPAYRPAYVYERPTYVYERPAYCHIEWRHNSWGQPYRVSVCPE